MKFTDLESKILGQIWSLNGEATVSQILDTWKEDKKPLYTTVLKTLQIMEGKGYVNHRKCGRAYAYYPIIAKDVVSVGLINKIINTFFNKSSMKMATTLINREKLSREEIEKLKKLIEEKEKELGDD